MNMQQALDFMRHHPWNMYYVDPVDPASGILDTRLKGMLNHGGYFGTPSTAYADRRERLDEIGTMINEVDMPSGWYDVDKYDFGLIDHMVGQVLDGHPDRYLIARVHMDAPAGWLKANPTEVCVYVNGPSKAEEIAALIDTEYFDPDGNPKSKEFLVSRQSLSSAKWLSDASVALEKLIEHLENSRWKDQVLGYMVIFGIWGECAWWGIWSGGNGMGDKGISHRKSFFRWAVDKYGSLPALRKAWNMPHLTSDTLAVPTPEERWQYDLPSPDWRRKTGLRSYLLTEDQKQVDCNEYLSHCVVNAIETFCRTVHEHAGKPAGAFYGYKQGIGGPCGQSALTQALASPNIDFLSAPKAYAYMMAGEPGQFQSTPQSIARKKMWIEENDVRSYHMLESDPNDPWSPKTEEDTVTCFWRELYRALTYGFSFWWMNINGVRDDWYTDENLIAMFRHQADFFKKWSPVPRDGVAEILCVEDAASINHTVTDGSFGEGLHLRLDRELRHCGAPVDRFRIEDLEDMDLSRYKFIVFTEAFVLPADKWQKILARIRPDAHILWNYAAALLDPAYNPENQKAVTGFRTVETPERMRHKDVYRHMFYHGARSVTDDYPYLSIQPEEGQEALQTTPDGYLLTARIRRGEGANIFAADITLRTPLLRRLVEDAGVTCCAPAYCSVLADEKLIGFFPHFDVQFTYHFDGLWRNVITGETVSGDVKLAIRSKKFSIFEKID